MRTSSSLFSRVLAVITACVAVAGCAGSSEQPISAAAVDTIGIAMPQGDSRWLDDGKNMIKQFEALGYRTDMRSAEKDAAVQVRQIDDMVDKGHRVIVVAAVDGSALKDPLARAAAKDIPVIAYDRLIRDSPNVDYYATFDNFKVGVQQATAIVDALGPAKPSRPYDVELFAGSADDNNATFFFNGAMSVLEPLIADGTLIVRSGQTSFAEAATKGWNGDVAKARMSRLLAASYRTERLDAVLSPNDGISRDILAALQGAGYGAGGNRFPVITGQDAELESVKLIAAGQQTATIFKDTRELAKVAVQMTDALLQGQTPTVNDTTQYDNGVKVVPTFLLQPVSVVKGNLQAVLVDSGYVQASDLS